MLKARLTIRIHILEHLLQVAFLHWRQRLNVVSRLFAGDLLHKLFVRRAAHAHNPQQLIDVCDEEGKLERKQTN